MADEILNNDQALLDSLEDKKEEKVVEPTEASDGKKKKKKFKKHIPIGHAYVSASFNNTIISITDLSGNVLAAGSAGSMGYSGTKKSTPYVAGLVAGSVATKAKNFGMSDISVFVKGIGSGRESAVRALQSSGMNVVAIKDLTPLPHNGCRRKKVRRV
ncbi:MAG: 30S ribosomal protein S11 [Patescibacteria group bacterium]